MGLQFADSYVALAAQNWKRVAVIHYADDLTLSVRHCTVHYILGLLCDPVNENLTSLHFIELNFMTSLLSRVKHQ